MNISEVQSGHSSVVALSGGVGGAKLVLGLANILPGEALTIVANTADDFEHLGLPICPDLDTVMYTLAGLNNREQGWGLADESWQTMEMLRNYGGETWFQLGDRDIATHLTRLQLLAQGHSLTEATKYMCQALGVAPLLIPMSDESVHTYVKTPDGDLPFQHYFVRQRCEPMVTGFYFRGIDSARPQAQVMAALANPATSAIIICPSNPFVSVQPMLALKGLKDAIRRSVAPVIAVSPIVAGTAIKGPAAKMMQELGIPTSALAVAEYYRGVIDGFVLDEADADQASSVHELGMAVEVAPTIMRSLEDRIHLAERVLAFAEQIKNSGRL